MARLLLRMEKGDYFAKTGEIRRNLPIDYIKARTWELRPQVKVAQEQNASNMLGESS